MIKFNEEEEDVLKEIVNISYGMATSLITNAAGNHVNLSVPEIIIAALSEIQTMFDELPVNVRECIMTSQKFKGAYKGESLLLVDGESAANFASMMLEEPAEELEQDDIDSCALELSNILTSVSIGRLAELLDSHMSFSAPNLVETKIDDLILDFKENNFEQFFVIKTWISAKSKNVVGYLIIFINEESFGILKKSINTFLEQNV